MAGFFKRLLSGRQRAPQTSVTDTVVEQCMILKFRPALSGDRTDALEDLLSEHIANHGLGEIDGHDTAVDHSETSIYAYGSDAIRLYRVALDITPSPAEFSCCDVYLRFGSADDDRAKEMTFPFGQEVPSEA